MNQEIQKKKTYLMVELIGILCFLYMYLCWLLYYVFFSKKLHVHFIIIQKPDSFNQSNFIHLFVRSSLQCDLIQAWPHYWYFFMLLSLSVLFFCNIFQGYIVFEANFLLRRFIGRDMPGEKGFLQINIRSSLFHFNPPSCGLSS